MSNSTSASFAITQHIPVSDHVYKYLKTRCGGAKMVATRTDFIGSMVLSLLTNNNDIRKERKNTKYTKLFQVTILEDATNRQGYFISATNAQLFNDQIDKMFREELFYHLIINSHLNEQKFLESMRRFLDVYNITEADIKEETLYRDFKRRRDRYQKKNILV